MGHPPDSVERIPRVVFRLLPKTALDGGGGGGLCANSYRDDRKSYRDGQIPPTMAWRVSHALCAGPVQRFDVHEVSSEGLWRPSLSIWGRAPQGGGGGVTC